MVPANASSTNPASRGENTASPDATRSIAATSSGPVIVLVTYPRAPARIVPITSSAASETDRARKRVVASCFAAAGSAQPTHHLGATAAGEVHVEQHHLRLVLEHGLHGLVDVGRLGDDVDGGAELGPDAGAEHGVVVDDHDGAWS